MAHDTALSRRALLAISAAASVGALARPAAAMPLPVPAVVSPDAELLRLGREHDVLYERIDAHNRHVVSLDDEGFDTLCDASTDVEFAIQDVPAETWEGVVVKARIAIEYVQRHEERLLDNMLPSLIEDILRIAHVSGKRYLPPSSSGEA